ncbi:MAG: hypothetical protein AAF616_03550 [Bacteroidota bacterium]
MDDKKKVESILAELGRKIDSLIEETKKAGSKVSEDTERKIKDLKGRKEHLEEEFRTKTESSRKTWKQAKVHLNEAADELRSAFEVLLKRKK